MRRKLRSWLGLGAVLSASLALTSATYADGGFDGDIQHVLLISVDGMHALDFANCANGIPGFNGGNPYCPNLAGLAQTGVTYTNASTSRPSDSFPGLMTLMTGASPRTMGVYYDVAFDRSYNPPLLTSGNGNPGSSTCTPGSPVGNSTEYDEGISFDKTKLNGGAPSGDGGVNSINPDYLVRDKNCNPVYPWNFIRVNTIFGVIHGAGGYTAWVDKHPSYSSVGGPTGTTSDTNVNDYYGPEINSTESNFTAVPALLRGPASCGSDFAGLPDQNSGVSSDDYTGSFENVQCYDGLHVSAILNEIDGKNHDGSSKAQVPNIFGMNFQAVSIGQKLIYQHGSNPGTGYSVKGGYLDSFGTPSPSLFQEIVFVDNSIGLMVSELKKKGLYGKTLFIVTAKHGQSPIDSSHYVANGSPNDPATILAGFLYPSENSALGPTEDDVALLWLQDQANTPTAISDLEADSAKIGLGELFWGPSLSIVYNTPGLPPNDPRTPDIIVAPNVGVTYSNSKKKLAEHGGFSHDDTNVMMVVSDPDLFPRTITGPVETAQVGPTVLKALGLDPGSLQGARQEGTTVLPDLSF